MGRRRGRGRGDAAASSRPNDGADADHNEEAQPQTMNDELNQLRQEVTALKAQLSRQKMHADKDNSIQEICDMFKISRPTLFTGLLTKNSNYATMNAVYRIL